MREGTGRKPIRSIGVIFFPPQRGEPMHVHTSVRQMKLSDNRLHQKSPEKEQLAEENQYIIE